MRIPNFLTRLAAPLMLALFALDSSAAAPAAVPAAAAPASGASGAAAIVPIEANGLTAQLLRQIGHWVDGLTDQLVKLEHAVVALPTLMRWLRTTFGTEHGQDLLIKGSTALLAVFIVGLALEWLLRRVLKRPRQALVEHAETVERRAREEDVRQARVRRESVAQGRREIEAREAAARAEVGAKLVGDVAAVTAHAARTANAKDRGAGAEAASEKAEATPAPDAASVLTERENAVAAGLETPPGDVALMRTQVDGTERVEAVKVDAGDGAGAGHGAEQVMAAAAESANAAQPPVAVPRSAEHWATLRHLPYALGALVLDLLPLALFFLAAGLVLRWLAGNQGAIEDMVSGFVDAYLTIRVTMAVVRLLVSPVGHGLRILRVSAELSRVVENWVRRIVVVAAVGLAISNGAGAFGASEVGRVAFMKLISLVVHIFVVVLIFHVRKPIGERIAAGADRHGAVAGVRNWLAEVWAYFAAFVVMAIWVVWALGVEDGFPKLVHFIGVSVGVIVAARLFAILALGGLGRAFHADTEAPGAGSSGSRGRLAERYYPIARSAVSAVIVIGAAIALLEVWGFNAIAWFRHGSVGRDLASAALTIAVAAGVAVAVWEMANAAVERRLARWTESGDLVRAARLRTLIPMLRSCLFIVIVLIVGLTALNEIGINTTPLLAGASIIGVALGFGSQKLVQDFITGIFLLMENAMQVGDWVTVAGVSGSVEYLSIRTVRLRAGDGSLHIVPFSSVSTVNNTNRGIGNAAVRVSVAYDSDIDQVIDELQKIGADMRADPAFQDLTLNDLELWGVDSVDGSMVTIAGQIRCVDKGRWGVQRAFNRKMFERFRELGIEIANPRASWVLPAENALATRAPLGPDATPRGAVSPPEA
ncbi:mechanosensitive ion channel [Robbsia sp. Bb-Pol-6]|uniref:Mechanosensitive ion channel n=1 Tax=Robbsia betulipollinis TaxID=2981849 RepID=A0ABT3ZNN1_9BURK|nr:mechanosensitive ion channel domain-containing protein [Robbsia betulipollinis]MCY0388141.1 mechanosensitive ion channel [Robbsia betulipollinis]